jgi:hypothetical protein
MNYTKEMIENIQEEHIRAMKSLLDIAGFEIEGEEGTDLKEIMTRFHDKGFRIHRFQGESLEHIFILSLNKEYVAGSIITTNFELGHIKRTMIPHNSKIEEKWSKAIKGGL